MDRAVSGESSLFYFPAGEVATVTLVFFRDLTPYSCVFMPVEAQYCHWGSYGRALWKPDGQAVLLPVPAFSVVHSRDL